MNESTHTLFCNPPFDWQTQKLAMPRGYGLLYFSLHRTRYNNLFCPKRSAARFSATGSNVSQLWQVIGIRLKIRAMSDAYERRPQKGVSVSVQLTNAALYAVIAVLAARGKGIGIRLHVHISTQSRLGFRLEYAGDVK